MNNYAKNKKSSDLKFWDVNNIYEWTKNVNEKLLVNGF